MQSDFSENLGLIAIVVLLLSLLIDAVLNSRWNKMYFTYGLPMFVMRVPVAFPHSNIPASAQLEGFHSIWVSSLAFREIEPDTYGFREKNFDFRFLHYSPVLHGMLFFDRDKNEVVVKGFANWFALCLSLILVGGALQSSDLLFKSLYLVVFALSMAVPYAIQCYLFSNIAKFAAQVWRRTYLRNRVGA